MQLFPINLLLEIFCDITTVISSEFADSYACTCKTFKQSQSIMAIYFYTKVSFGPYVIVRRSDERSLSFLFLAIIKINNIIDVIIVLIGHWQES